MNTEKSTDGVQIASALAKHDDLAAALDHVCERIEEQLEGAPELSFVFVSANHVNDCQQIADVICDRLATERLLGCAGESIVGVGEEVEGDSAISLWCAKMPDTTLLPMHLRFERTTDGGSILGWHDELLTDWPPDAAMILMGDPFSFPADAMLEQLNRDQPGVGVVGGMASAGQEPGSNRLILGRRVETEGAVAVVLSGGVRLRTVVSQGCRPIGTPLVITKAERNVIQELGGRAAMLQLKEIFDALPNYEKEIVQRGLHVGRVISEYQERREQGDFLIRNVMGIDPDNGSIVIGDFIRPGQTVQFHIRDDKTADNDLGQLLLESRKRSELPPRGALLFTCNGRGTRLFGDPHHDAALIAAHLGAIPLAGFFAAGELGPVSGANFMHGFTASMMLFE